MTHTNSIRRLQDLIPMKMNRIYVLRPDAGQRMPSQSSALFLSVTGARGSGGNFKRQGVQQVLELPALGHPAGEGGGPGGWHVQVAAKSDEVEVALQVVEAKRSGCCRHTVAGQAIKGADASRWTRRRSAHGKMSLQWCRAGSMVHSCCSAGTLSSASTMHRGGG